MKSKSYEIIDNPDNFSYSGLNCIDSLYELYKKQKIKKKILFSMK